MRKLIFIGGGIFIGALAMLGFTRQQIASVPAPAFHEHADFAVFLNGVQYNFARPEFMSTKPCVLQSNASGLIDVAHAHEGEELDDVVHLHDNIGTVVHVHREGVTWSDFFESLGMSFTNDQFVDAEGNTYDADTKHAFVFIVNGEKVSELANRPIRDLDQVLISFGASQRPDAEIWAEYGHVTNDACLSSGSCKHRGNTPLESCGASAPTTPKFLKWLGIK